MAKSRVTKNATFGNAFRYYIPQSIIANSSKHGVLLAATAALTAKPSSPPTGASGVRSINDG